MLNAPSIRQFLAGLHGEVIERGAPCYGEARKLYNGMIAKRFSIDGDSPHGAWVAGDRAFDWKRFQNPATGRQAASGTRKKRL